MGLYGAPSSDWPVKTEWKGEEDARDECDDISGPQDVVADQSCDDASDGVADDDVVTYHRWKRRKKNVIGKT